MTEPAGTGPVSERGSLAGYFSTSAHATASPARVDGWCQERRAIATRGVPTGIRQGGPWGSMT